MLNSGTDWTNSPLPPIIKQRYPKSIVKSLNELLSNGQIEWRFTGGTHFAIRKADDTDLEHCTLTTSKSASNPIYSKKIRSFMRKV